MKFKVAFGILLLFVFGCRDYSEKTPYRTICLMNIFQIDFINEDSISISQCGYYKKDKKFILKKNEDFLATGGHLNFVLKEINMQEKSIKMKYEQNFTLEGEHQYKEGEFNIYNSEIKSCEFWRKKNK